MKKILFIIITVWGSITLLSQSPILPLNTPYHQITHNSYLKDTQNQLSPFVGTWVYQQGNTKVTIKFQKVMDYKNTGPAPHYYKDRLKANYKVEKNGGIIYDNLNESIDIARIQGGVFKIDRYTLLYVDYVKCDIWGDVEIWIDANGELHWEMYMSDPNPYKIEECPAFQNPDFHDSMTIPYEMVLTKQ